MATVIQRVMHFISPLGRGKRAIQRLLGGRRPRVPVPQPEVVPPRVTCVATVWGGDVAQLESRCQEVLHQDWQPLDVLVFAREAELARVSTVNGKAMVGMRCIELPDMTNAEMQAAGWQDGIPMRVLKPLVAEFWLDLAPSGCGEAVEPDRIRNMIASFAQDPDVAVIRAGGDGTSSRSWSLSRQLVKSANAIDHPIFDASNVDPTGAKPVADGQPFVLRFDGDSDRPYRFRSWLAEPCVSAWSVDRKTSERLALLTNRSVQAVNAEQALARLKVRIAEDGPAIMRMYRGAVSKHVVLQADNFTEGGMEQVIIDLAEALQQEGFTTSLLILGTEGSAAQRARDLGLRVDNLKPDPEAYVSYLEQTGAALINAHYSTFGADLCAERGLPFVQTMHNMYMWFGAPQIDAYRAADPHTSAYVCVSNNVARYGDVTVGLSPSSMLVIPNGCNTGFRPTPEYLAAADALRVELGMPEGAKVFLNVGSIQPPKAQHLVLAAFAELVSDHPEAHLVFLGGPADDLYYEAQRKATTKHGLDDRVHWVGRRSDVHAFHQLAVALVQPSFFEGWSLAITEAVLAELPVIATDVGGAVEQLRGTDGILLPACVPDITAIHADNLIPILEGSYPELEEHIHQAMRTMLTRGAGRSRMPENWPSLLRDTAYSRCAEIYHWLAAGGTAAASRYWLRPQAKAEA